MLDDKIILENSRRLNVLYVEDDKELAKTTKDLLAIYFKSVRLLEDGALGLEAYKEYYKQTGSYYDIVISDVKMPNLSGIEMARKIRMLNTEQSVIFITAFPDFEYLNAAIEIGVDGFLKKPLELTALKNILYKTSQKLADKAIMDAHFAQIEEDNIENLDVINAKEFHSAQDILDDLEKHKEKLSHIWCDTPIVIERLAKHEIDAEYFRSHFGMKVVEYFLGVISRKNEAGNCPVIFIMLDYFKHKDLSLDDIFMICVHFKNTVTSYILSHYRFNQQLFDDISFILDSNFEGVVRNYLLLKGYTKVETTENISMETPVVEEEFITSYVDYVLEHDVYELQDLEEDIDTLSIKVTDKKRVSVDDIIVLGAGIKRYGTVLSNYHLFSKLGMKIILLGDNFQENASLLFENEEKRMNISTLLEGFVNDLMTWRREIFENNIENPHFLDDSFFSNVDTIIMFIEYDENSVVADESMDDADFFDF